MTLERRLALLLRYGTLLATLVTAVGVCGAGARTVSVGLALFVATPIVRVAVMLASFARARDVRFALAAAAVLATILVGAALGMWMG